jgi:hypothetical protein
MADQATQLSNIGRAIETITGRAAAPAEIQRLLAIACVLGMREDDGMLPILAVLDAYHGIFSRLPAEMKSAAKAATDGAAAQAKDRVAEAVSHLVPTVESAVERTAAGVVRRIYVARSLWSIAVVVMILAAVFFVGELIGAGFLHAVQAARANLSWFDAFGPLSWRAGLAAAAVALGIWGYYDYISTREEGRSWLPFIAAALLAAVVIARTAMGVF